MGWCGGSEIADTFWKIIKKYVPKKDQKKVAKMAVECLEDQDWDTWEESPEICKAAGIDLDYVDEDWECEEDEEQCDCCCKKTNKKEKKNV